MKHIWTAIHNVIAHPLLVVAALLTIPMSICIFIHDRIERFHDWTAEKM